MQFTEKFIEINAPVERVFDYFSDFENLPRWMRHIKEVRHTGRHYTRWTADAPLGTSIEWEAETTHFEPDHKIAWRSVRGDIDTEGEVIFEETRRGTTLMHVVLGYDPPAGRLGAMFARLFGNDPEEELEEDLERFAAVVEGRRRNTRRDDYGEAARYGRAFDRWPVKGRWRDDEGRARPARELFDDDRERDHLRTGRHEPVDDARDDHRRRGRSDDEPEGRRRFYEELRRARTSQEEGLRQYREQRTRDEERRYRAERESEMRRRSDERGARRAEQERRRQDDSSRPPRHEDDERARSNYALTPRERERERARRRLDEEYAEKAFQRGVDKLMDDAPSRRWNRWKE